jgi:hypothetical protein
MPPQCGYPPAAAAAAAAGGYDDEFVDDEDACMALMQHFEEQQPPLDSARTPAAAPAAKQRRRQSGKQQAGSSSAPKGKPPRGRVSGSAAGKAKPAAGAAVVAVCDDQRELGRDALIDLRGKLADWYKTPVDAIFNKKQLSKMAEAGAVVSAARLVAVMCSCTLCIRYKASLYCGTTWHPCHALSRVWTTS